LWGRFSGSRRCESCEESSADTVTRSSSEGLTVIELHLPSACIPGQRKLLREAVTQVGKRSRNFFPIQAWKLRKRASDFAWIPGSRKGGLVHESEEHSLRGSIRRWDRPRSGSSVIACITASLLESVRHTRFLLQETGIGETPDDDRLQSTPDKIRLEQMRIPGVV